MLGRWQPWHKGHTELFKKALQLSGQVCIMFRDVAGVDAGVVGQSDNPFEFEDVKLEFNDDAIKEIAKKAISKKTGARGLRSILENILLKTMFELPDMENVIKVTVDSSAVKGNSEPIVTYGKKTSTSVA